MKGGERVNIVVLKALAVQNLQSPSNRVQSVQASSGTFGSVFGSAVAAGTAVVAPVEQQSTGQVSNDSIQAVLNAQSVEELESALKELGGDGVLSSMTNVGSLEELASLLNIEPKQLMESVLSLLEKAGLSQEDLSEVANSTDIWNVLNAIDTVSPQFFTQLSDELAGKGELSKQQAVDLLAVLKTVALVAPKTDLLLKQEQQVFSLQSYLVAAAGQFEETLNSNSSTKLDMLQLMESKSAARIVIQTNPGQSQTEDGVSNKSAESTQQVSANTTSVAVPKGEFTITEAENRNNAARNEALVREMQNVFKRANFGQTGGSNRLLIKLYPEHLGQVRIELLQVNGIMTARILASTALGKEMLDSQLNQLRQAFLQQNLPVERIDVSQTLQDTARNDREQAFNQQFKNEGQENDTQQEQNDEEQLTFQEYMIELEV